jgi:hypothetical protein
VRERRSLLGYTAPPCCALAARLSGTVVYEWVAAALSAAS